MTDQQARQKYAVQKCQAKARGISWEFTYETWREWWGDDLDRRGVRALDLSMQRKADRGPYAPWNVTKGHPRQNRVTRAAVQQTKKWAEIAAQNRLEAALVETDDSPDDRPEDNELGYESIWRKFG